MVQQNKRKINQDTSLLFENNNAHQMISYDVDDRFIVNTSANSFTFAWNTKFISDIQIVFTKGFRVSSSNQRIRISWGNGGQNSLSFRIPFNKGTNYNNYIISFNHETKELTGYYNGFKCGAALTGNPLIIDVDDISGDNKNPFPDNRIGRSGSLRINFTPNTYSTRVINNIIWLNKAISENEAKDFSKLSGYIPKKLHPYVIYHQTLAQKKYDKADTDFVNKYGNNFTTGDTISYDVTNIYNYLKQDSYNQDSTAFKIVDTSGSGGTKIFSSLQSTGTGDFELQWTTKDRSNDAVFYTGLYDGTLTASTNIQYGFTPDTTYDDIFIVTGGTSIDILLNYSDFTNNTPLFKLRRLSGVVSAELIDIDGTVKYFQELATSDDFDYNIGSFKTQNGINEINNLMLNKVAITKQEGSGSADFTYGGALTLALKNLPAKVLGFTGDTLGQNNTYSGLTNIYNTKTQKSEYQKGLLIYSKFSDSNGYFYGNRIWRMYNTTPQNELPIAGSSFTVYFKGKIMKGDNLRSFSFLSMGSVEFYKQNNLKWRNFATGQNLGIGKFSGSATNNNQDFLFTINFNPTNNEYKWFIKIGQNKGKYTFTGDTWTYSNNVISLGRRGNSVGSNFNLNIQKWLLFDYTKTDEQMQSWINGDINIDNDTSPVLAYDFNVKQGELDSVSSKPFYPYIGQSIFQLQKLNNKNYTYEPSSVDNVLPQINEGLEMDGSFNNQRIVYSANTIASLNQENFTIIWFGIRNEYSSVNRNGYIFGKLGNENTGNFKGYEVFFNSGTNNVVSFRLYNDTSSNGVLSGGDIVSDNHTLKTISMVGFQKRNNDFRLIYNNNATDWITTDNYVSTDSSIVINKAPIGSNNTGLVGTHFYYGVTHDIIPLIDLYDYYHNSIYKTPNMDITSLVFNDNGNYFDDGDVVKIRDYNNHSNGVEIQGYSGTTTIDQINTIKNNIINIKTYR